jgi:hypothetical protein
MTGERSTKGRYGWCEVPAHIHVVGLERHRFRMTEGDGRRLFLQIRERIRGRIIATVNDEFRKRSLSDV